MVITVPYCLTLFVVMVISVTMVTIAMVISISVLTTVCFVLAL